jgi:hypothetical protein
VGVTRSETAGKTPVAQASGLGDDVSVAAVTFSFIKRLIGPLDGIRQVFALACVVKPDGHAQSQDFIVIGRYRR